MADDNAAEDDPTELSIEAIVEDEDLRAAASDLSVEAIEQRIVFLIPALPPTARRKEKRRQHGEEGRGRDRDRDRNRDRDPRDESRRRKARKRIKLALALPAIPFSSSNGDGGALAPIHRELLYRSKTSFLTKRVERRGGLRLWLSSKGLGRFAPIFQQQKIDVGKLSHLTMEALKKMGVFPVGPRRKLISAIQQLCL